MSDYPKCSHCGGPVYAGEPITYDGFGNIAHRFKTWCTWYEEQQKKSKNEDAQFLEDCGIDPNSLIK